MTPSFFKACREATFHAQEIARLWPLWCQTHEGCEVQRGRGTGYKDCLYLRSESREWLLLQYVQHIHKGLVLRLVFQGPLSLRHATVHAHPAAWKYHSPPVFLPPPSNV